MTKEVTIYEFRAEVVEVKEKTYSHREPHMKILLEVPECDVKKARELIGNISGRCFNVAMSDDGEVINVTKP